MSATRVTVTPEIPGPTAPTVTGKAEAEKAQAQNQNNAPAQQQEQKSFRPEKFKTDEEWAKAYAELERKQSQATPPQKADEKPNAEQKPGEGDANKPEVKATDKAFDSYFKEYAEKGQLSNESYAALEKQGVTKAHVDAYIRGVQAEQQQSETKVFEAVGGKEKYAEITAWAAKNLKADEISAFNSTLENGSVEQIVLAAQGLSTRFTAANGHQPSTRLRGSASGAAVEPFKSTAEVTRAMSDPRYKTDQAYRDEVAERLRTSTVL